MEDEPTEEWTDMPIDSTPYISNTVQYDWGINQVLYLCLSTRGRAHACLHDTKFALHAHAMGAFSIFAALGTAFGR